MIINFSMKSRSVCGSVILSVCLGAFFCTATAHAGVLRPADYTESPNADTPLGVPATKTTELGGTGIQVHQPAVLKIEGNIASNGQDYVLIDLPALKALEPYSIKTSTVVTDGVLEFSGVLMRDVLEHVGARGKAVTATALNGYEIKIPVRDFVHFDVVLAWAANGQPLRADDKGPFWIVYPRDQHEVLQDIRYDYRWVWQLSSLKVH